VTNIGGDSTKPFASTGTPEGQELDGRTQPNPQAPAAPSARAVKVEMTSFAGGSQQLDKLLNGVGVVDAAAVEATKQAILEARFRIDSEVVADRLLATVRESLVGQQKR
jgi:negative regulator of flagellin synthesis FlgM